MGKNEPQSRSQPLGPLMLDVEGEVLKTDDIRRLQHPSVGGVVLFSRNFVNREQLCELVQSIRALRAPELLIAVDQEGGRVQRFKDGFTRFPPMAAFGDLFDTAEENKEEILGLVSCTAQLLAEELIDCGIDISFAPVLDLGLHGDTVIGNRAFHKHPETLSKIAEAFIDGMNRAGMRATGKHFPGHGHVLADSHLETPVDRRKYEDIYQQDMQPFILLKDKLAALMTAHIAFPEVDAQLPTFSPYWLQTVLREQIGYEGLVFSDDLAMHGASIGGDIVERAEQALSAGCDMALLCNDHEAMDRLLEAGTFRASAKSQQRIEHMKARPGIKLGSAELDEAKNQLASLYEAYKAGSAASDQVSVA